MNPKSFFGELKRRNVYKVAIAYAVVAWLLLQAASILFPTFEAPPWVMKVFVALIVLRRDFWRRDTKRPHRSLVRRQDRRRIAGLSSLLA